MRAGIVGMGIMGGLLALGLDKAGWQVSLFDQGLSTGNCSQAAAGLLTPFSELDRSDPLIADLGQESVALHWPRIIEQLPESIYFQSSGSIALSHPQDQAEWQLFSQKIARQNRACFKYLTQKELSLLEPELSSFEQAYYFPQEAHIDTQSVLTALQKYFSLNKIAVYTNTRVLSLGPQSIHTQNKAYGFDMVFDCRGLGAKSHFAALRGLRGELIYLDAPEVQLKRPVRFLHPRYSLYVVPRAGNKYLVGASEMEVEDYSPISVRTSLELLTAAYYLHPGFSEARILHSLTQCRPTLANHLPCIKHTEGLIAVNGLYRHGYLIAPALVEEILGALQSSRSSIKYPEIWESMHDHRLS